MLPTHMHKYVYAKDAHTFCRGGIFGMPTCVVLCSGNVPGVQVKDFPPSAKTMCHIVQKKKKKSDQWSRCTLERLPRK